MSGTSIIAQIFVPLSMRTQLSSGVICLGFDLNIKLSIFMNVNAKID